MIAVAMKTYINLDNDEKIYLMLLGFRNAETYMWIFFTMIGISWFILQNLNGNSQKCGSLNSAPTFKDDQKKWGEIID